MSSVSSDVSSIVDRSLTLSIDWEDFGQLIARDCCGIETRPRGDIDRQTDIILQLLDETGRKATFFALGMLAKYKPHLLRRIFSEGHEIALHGMSHVRMTQLSRQDATRDILGARHLVEDSAGTRVYGYRAPYFSVDRGNLYLLDVLAEAGFEYDSSIVPVRTRRYGIEGFDGTDTYYELPGGGRLVELPLTTFRWMGRIWAVSGGGYFRAMPRAVIREIFSRIAEDPRHAKMIYMHPYEFDSIPLDPSANFPDGFTIPRGRDVMLRARWNVFRQSVRSSVRMLLNRHSFVTCKERSDDVKRKATCPRLLERPQPTLQ